MESKDIAEVLKIFILSATLLVLVFLLGKCTNEGSRINLEKEKLQINKNK